MIADSPATANFVHKQRADYGGNWEISDGLWAVFAVKNDDLAGRQIAEELLADAPFPCATGESEDSAWVLYYVDQQHRFAAVGWLEQLHCSLNGAVKPPPVETDELVTELMESEMPHRTATKLATWHEQGRLSAGVLQDRATVRALLDRLHNREALYFNAFHTLLENHLFDLVRLHERLIDEDVQLLNHLTQGSLSQDPFDNNRQTTAAKIRQLLIQFGLISPLDQQKNRELGNPYGLMTDVEVTADEVEFRLDGSDRTARKTDFGEAVRALRRVISLGENVAGASTRSPWTANDTGYPIRAIKQRIAARPEIDPLDWLYFFERSLVEPKR